MAAASRLYDALPVLGQNVFCTLAGWRRSRERFGPHFRRTLAAWERSAFEPREKLVALQREAFGRLLRRAREHVPHYRDLPPPSDARDPEEALQRTLAAIPPLDRREVRERPDDFVARDVPAARRLVLHTSGTTGSALPVVQTRERIAELHALLWRQRRAFGTDLADPFMTFGGQSVVPVDARRPPYWRDNWWGGQRLFSTYHMSPSTLPAYVDAIHATRARYVQGYPSAIALAARALLAAGRPLAKGRLAGVFTSSETLLGAQRAEIEAAFAAPVGDHYSGVEMVAGITGCPEGRLHADMEFGLLEIETEEETSELVRGPLLATGLGSVATVLLRYRTGDVATRSKRGCPCGRGGDVFLAIDGRIEDYVVTPDGRRIGRMDHVFKDTAEVAEAQIRQETPEAIEVLLVPRAAFGEAAERAVRAALRARVGETLRIAIRVVPSLPREPNGKLRAVVSKVGRIDA